MLAVRCALLAALLAAPRAAPAPAPGPGGCPALGKGAAHLEGWAGGRGGGGNRCGRRGWGLRGAVRGGKEG